MPLPAPMESNRLKDKNRSFVNLDSAFLAVCGFPVVHVGLLARADAPVDLIEDALAK